MPGSGFLAGTTSPAKSSMPRRLLLADRVLEHRPHGLLGRRRGDGDRPARGQRRVDDRARSRGGRASRRRRPSRCRRRSCACASAPAAPSGPRGRPAGRARGRNPRSAADAIRSLPPPILSRSPYSSSDQRTGRPSASKVWLNAGRCPKRSVSASTPSQSKISVVMARRLRAGRGLADGAEQPDVLVRHRRDRGAHVREQRRRVVLGRGSRRGTRGARRRTRS